jgi:hypothetical protein
MNRLVVWLSVTAMALGSLAAFAQSERSAAVTACNAGNRGTINCPTYTVPAATAVQHASMGGSMTVGPGFAPLFNGAVPPNGFMVQLNVSTELGNFCWVNDNGPANGEAPPSGFLIGGVSAPFTPWPFLFVTPPGYKPIGAVSIWCSGSVYIETRGW